MTASDSGRGHLRLVTFVLLAAVAVSGVGFAQAADKPAVKPTDNPEKLMRIGDDPGASQGATRAQPLVSTWDFVRMVLILAAVVGAIYLFFYLLRRTMSPARNESGMIRLLGQRSLNGSRALYLVEVGATVLLVGAADSQVSLVARITDKESLDSIRVAMAQSAERPESRRSFATLIGGMFAPAARSLSAHDGLSFLRRQKERLKRM